MRTPVTGRPTGRLLTLLSASAVAAMVAAPLAIGAGEGSSLRGGARNPAGGASNELSRETGIIAQNSTYGTRQSNKGSGGGAIYGCRSTSAARPCIKANNLSSGLAFNFTWGDGAVGGRLQSNAKDPSSVKPFTTNATGVADGLNADRVDGLDAAQVAAAARVYTKIAPVAATGALGSTTRGAKAATRTAAGQYRVTFDGPIDACGYTATVLGSATSAGTANVAPVAGQNTQLDVFTRAGSDNALADRAFHLVANC